MKRILTLCLLLCALRSSAMAEGVAPYVREVYRNATLNANTTTTAVCFDSNERVAFFSIVLSNVSGSSPTFSAQLQDQIDGATKYIDMTGYLFEATSSDLDQKFLLSDDRRIGPCVRAAITLGGSSPVYNVVIRAHYGKP